MGQQQQYCQNCNKDNLYFQLLLLWRLEEVLKKPVGLIPATNKAHDRGRRIKEGEVFRLWTINRSHHSSDKDTKEIFLIKPIEITLVTRSISFIVKEGQRSVFFYFWAFFVGVVLVRPCQLSYFVFTRSGAMWLCVWVVFPVGTWGTDWRFMMMRHSENYGHNR